MAKIALKDAYIAAAGTNLSHHLSSATLADPAVAVDTTFVGTDGDDGIFTPTP